MTSGDRGSATRSPRGDRRQLPVHLVVAAGLTTAAYALSLGIVTRWQVASDRSVIEDRAPISQAIGMLSHHHNRLERGLRRAGRSFEAASSRYSTVAARMDGLHRDLEELASVVAQIEGSSLRIPSSLVLPAVPNVAPAAAPAAAAPPTNATTGGSGGN